MNAYEKPELVVFGDFTQLTQADCVAPHPNATTDSAPGGLATFCAADPRYEV